MSAVLVGVALALALLLDPGGRAGPRGWTVPHRRLRRRHCLAPRRHLFRRGRRRAAADSTPEVEVAEVIELLALALLGGAAVASALGSVAAVVGGARGAELRAVTDMLAQGVEEESAWDRVPSHWVSVRRALALAGRAGAPPVVTLRAAAADLRRERQAALEARTARLTVLLALPLALAFLPGFLLTTVVPVVLALAGGLLARGG